MADGWIKLHRKFLSSSIWENPNLARFWIWCLLKASHSSVKARVRYIEVELAPGQFVFGRAKAAEDTGLSEQEVRTCVKALELEKTISLTKHSTRQFSVLTICKWDSYQIEKQSSNQPFTGEPPTSHQRPTTYKNDKETNNSLSLTRARDGEEGEKGGAPEPDPPGPEPPTDDMPESLIQVAETVISTMPVHQLRLLLLDGHPAEWIEKALLDAGHRGLKGKRAVDYCRGTLRGWHEDGGPPDEQRARNDGGRKGTGKAAATDRGKETVRTGDVL